MYVVCTHTHTASCDMSFGDTAHQWLSKLSLMYYVLKICFMDVLFCGSTEHRRGHKYCTGFSQLSGACV